jgi:pyroglutamyl-peptidase
MALTILLTGFGTFPGAPYNPTAELVAALARRRHPAFAGVRRVAHVFPTSYHAVDSELPALLARERPDVLVMFGLALRSKSLRIETRAQNALSRIVPDAGGHLPSVAMIVPNGPAALTLRAPAQRLLAAARATGIPARLSRDAGRYLCNYLCWRAGEAAAKAQPGSGPRIVTFVHVPPVRATRIDTLVRAGEAIVLAALAAARAQH